MKLMSGRQYKNDISDVVGILWEHQHNNHPLTLDMLHSAVVNLYGRWDMLPQSLQEFINQLMKDGSLEQMYEKYRTSESKMRELSLDFEEKYPNVTNEDNVNDIIQILKNRKK